MTALCQVDSNHIQALSTQKYLIMSMKTIHLREIHRYYAIQMKVMITIQMIIQVSKNDEFI